MCVRNTICLFCCLVSASDFFASTRVHAYDSTTPFLFELHRLLRPPFNEIRFRINVMRGSLYSKSATGLLESSRQNSSKKKLRNERNELKTKLSKERETSALKKKLSKERESQGVSKLLSEEEGKNSNAVPPPVPPETEVPGHAPPVKPAVLGRSMRGNSVPEAFLSLPGGEQGIELHNI